MDLVEVAPSEEPEEEPEWRQEPESEAGKLQFILPQKYPLTLELHA